MRCYFQGKKIKQQNPRPLVEVGDLFVARLTMLVFHGYFSRKLLSHLCGLCSSFPVTCVYGDREKLVVRHLFPVFSRVLPAKIAVASLRFVVVFPCRLRLWRQGKACCATPFSCFFTGVAREICCRSYRLVEHFDFDIIDHVLSTELSDRITVEGELVNF